jgi:pimeloyl-ACP methyl ester carboxylesterase
VRARDCHDYLSDHGIDVAAYGVEEMAADLADLIDVRRLAPVTLVTYGSTSRIALELLRRHSGDVRALVLDTPDLPGVDPRALAPATTASAIAKVLRWCQADRDCRTRHPEPTTLLRRAQSQLSARPLRLDAQTPTGDVRVVLDPALLVRLARQSLTDGGSAGTWGLPLALPRLFTAVLRSDRPRLRLALGELLGAQGPWCAGYRNKCMSSHVVDEGVWNTVLCRDIAPFTSPDAPRTASRPGFRQAYDDSWWWDVCSHWPVPPASATTAEPLITDVPVLVLVGGLAAPVPEETIRRWTARMPHVSIVVDPTGSHNVLGIGCMGEIRDGWLTDPHPVPVHPACAATRLEW